ncbi:MAG: keratin [Ruminococcaceae bacterium]|nr:keratin [Oscillospiraceae bacterium]
MSKDKILKKSAFGGFKKEDVLDYIEKLQQEIVSLKRDASDCAAYKREVEALKSSAADKDKTAETLKAENEALKVENASCIEKNASLALKIEQLNAILEKSKEEASEYKAKYDELCEEHSKVTDVSKLVSEAKESVSKITLDAKRSVDSVRIDVSAAADRLKTVCVNFESSLSSLKSGTDALLETLSSASDKLDSVDIKEE